MRRTVAGAAVALALALALAACVPPGAAPSAPSAVGVFAAASLRDAFDAIAIEYREQTGVELVMSVDASSALRTQIIEGAQPDIFASADLANAQAVVDAGLGGELSVFARNRLVLVVPAVDAAVSSWQALANPGVRVVAAGEDVPISRYAARVVRALATLRAAPPGFTEAYEANVVSREDNVRAALAKVELGEGDAAFVYETDARATDDVRVIRLPPGATVEAEYALVVLADASPAARAFAEWVLGAEGQAVLARFGFSPVGP